MDDETPTVEVHVPDVPAPKATLCWTQDPATMSRCTLRQHDATTPHLWELVARVRILETEVARLGALVHAAYAEGWQTRLTTPRSLAYVWHHSMSKKALESPTS